jgi:hypothetical protein
VGNDPRGESERQGSVKVHPICFKSSIITQFMEFKFKCPHCGQNLSADTAEAGLTGSCPSCTREFSVPVAFTPPSKWRRWRVFSAVPVGLILLYAVWMTFGKYLFPKHVSEPPGFSVKESRSSKSTKSAAPVDDRLIVKGLWLGMDVDEALAAIIEQGEGRISSELATPASEKGFDLLYKGPRDQRGYRYGGIRIDPQTRAVTAFFFEDRMTDFLFNATDLTPREFAQKFMDAYGISQMAPTMAWGQQAWRYESPRGWTLLITVKKTVDVSRTPERKFN